MLIFFCQRSLKSTACELPSAEGFIDVLLFPERKQYSFRNDNIVQDLNSFLNHVMSSEPFPGTITENSNHFIFVCSHESMDKRCGYCGPRLVNAFKKRVAHYNLSNVKVVKTSHVGGHKFAGNVIVYPSGKINFFFLLLY